MIQLRPYQNNIISTIKNRYRNNAKRVIMCSPTGSGKTFMFSFMIKTAVEKGKKCLVLTHRTELLTQAGGAVNHLNIEPILINPENKRPNLIDGQLYISMAQTLRRRVQKNDYLNWINSIDLLIIDEAHTADADFIWDLVPDKCYVVGATATPKRRGNQKSLHLFYDCIVNEISISELIDLGYLSKPKYFMDDSSANEIEKAKIKSGDYDQNDIATIFEQNRVYDGVLENYNLYARNKKTLIFSSNIESSYKLIQHLKRNGIMAKHLDHTATKEERKGTLKWFDETPNAIISNVGILTAGFDQPDIECVILYRATKSIPLLLQMIGRGSRITETKKEFIILDFGTNIKRLGAWHIPRKWSLKHTKKKGLAPTKECPECSAILPARIMQCTFCGHDFEPTTEEKEEAELVILREMNYNAVKDFKESNDFERLDLYAKAKGYKAGWVVHQLSDNQLKAYAKYKGYDPYWVEIQLNRRR